ncbi:MFS transporter [Phycicoccus sonneratiae]|uniref:MFS transporter n=1 Tax=Phycicoccus sonneratiae TaxID=2807628 RepID=A0ABS2CPU9_9MICO|nr:MFS transporter [Phycicoccus sonneraticus]MBM6401865.1 MFS transporter [Phycicoccus sonneraticus]
MTTTPAPLRADRDFRRFWLARQVSIAGTLVTAVALPVLVYRLSGSPSLTALVTLVEGLPYLLFGLVSGALSDRLDRRRVMVVADLVSALAIGSVPLAHELGVLTVAHALLAGFLAQASFVFFDGAAFGALPSIVGRERLGAANAAIWGFGSLLDLGMPMLTGVLLALMHPALLLGVDALSFAASAACVIGITVRLNAVRDLPPLSAAALVGEVRDGLRYLVGHAGVRSQTAIGFLQSLSGAGFMALSVPFADRILGVGTSGWRFGLLFATWGVGGILAALVTPRLHRRMPTSRVTLLALPVSAASGLVVVTTSSWVVAVTVMALWGVSYQSVVLTSITYRQQVTPEHLLGRVNTAGRMLSFGVGWTTGALGAGAAAGLLGTRGALVTVVSVGVLAAVFGWLSPLRTLERDGVREAVA